MESANAAASAVSVNSADAYVGCCLAGLGFRLVQAPLASMEQLIASGQLVEVLEP